MKLSANLLNNIKFILLLVLGIFIAADLFDFQITKITGFDNLKFIVLVLYFITYIAELKVKLRQVKVELNKIKTIYKHHV
jgi:hypothetical protein